MGSLVVALVIGDIDGTATRFRGPAAGWLPAPARPSGPRQWVVDLHAGPLVRSVTCRVGDPWTEGPASWRSLAWRPSGERGDLVPIQWLLPSFTGEIGITRSPEDALQLVLRGSYAAPVGVVGAVFDAALLRRVAERTARRFLREVAGRLPVHAEPAEGDGPSYFPLQ
jgi:hypothetical protein